jgi:transcriptional regulator with XRE-family HTH domain
MPNDLAMSVDFMNAQERDPVARVVRMLQAGQPLPTYPDPSSALGPRLREIRLERGISLREIARRLDLSPSSISQIETGKIQPSVRTLYALAAEFGVSVDEILFDQQTSSRAEHSSTFDGSGVALQPAEDRPSIALNAGVTWERLMLWADEDVDFIEATYAPRGASGPPEALLRHSGREFGHVLSGTLQVVVGHDKFTLGPGDSISFPSSTPHRLSNEGSEPVKAIWVIRGRRRDPLLTPETEVGGQ